MGFLLRRVLLPLIVWFLLLALASTFIPESYAALRPLPAILFGIALLYWWLTSLARWLVRRRRWVTLGYLMANLATAIMLTNLFLAASFALNSYDKNLAGIMGLVGMIAGPGWLLWSIAHLLRYGKRRHKNSIWWQLLSALLEQVDEAAKPAPTKTKPTRRQRPAEPQRTKPPAPANRQAPSTPKPASKPLYTPVGAGGERAKTSGAAIPPRVTVPTRVSNDAQDFVQQAQEWARRQETVGNYVPFESYSPTYRQMSFEQQQWYFYWRTQLRQGKPLATDLSYLFVYVYELLNVVGANSPTDARNRLVSFWHVYRGLQPKLDSSLVDWVADFSVLHNLSESALAWYANVLSEGVTNKNNEQLQLEAWYQQGRDYDALPAPTLYALAGYAAQQNKFYQAYQGEVALDDALKRGVAVIDGYVQQQQQLSLYELYLPMPTQSVIRPPLQGALHTYPTTPIVIGRVRPWLSEGGLKNDLRQILRYTENILRTQEGFKTKLRGVTLPPEWATVLDQAFVKALPKRTVSIDLADAAALQRESDALRQRLLDASEVGTPDEPQLTTSAPALPPSATSPTIVPAIERPDDAPTGLLTDLPALIAIMGSATSEATELLRSLRTRQWQTVPTNLNTGGNGFVSLLFDRVNEQAIEALGDALLFIEGDEWVVAEDYRDEIAYLLDHPEFAAQVPVAGEPMSSNVAPAATAQHDLIPTGWEECVRQMQPLGWATLAIVLGQEEVMSKLEALARSELLTANQLLDQINEVGLASVGDILLDVATDPPQVIEEYQEPLGELVVWAQEHDQIRGLL